MPHMLDGMTIPGVAVPENKQLQKCDWSKCEGLHEAKITYPKGGNVARQGSAIRDALLGAKMEPWNKGSYGVPSKPIYIESGGKVTVRVEYRSDGTMYGIDAHHIIPIEQVGETSTLKDNAVLAGWDVNDVSNGMCLPSFAADVAIHQLQLHSGSHSPKYKKAVEDRLANIEELYETACRGKESGEFSENLASALKAQSASIRRKILSIRQHARGADFLPLHGDSMDVFKRSLQQYEDRRKRYREQGG